MQSTCNEEPGDYSSIIKDDMMCAEAAQGIGTCMGDRGGPLTVKLANKHHLAGVISHSFGCATVS